MLSALTLYSYVDSDGRTIVVSSLEKVPERFRDQIKSGNIGPAREDLPEEGAGNPSGNVVEHHDRIVNTGNGLQIASPPLYHGSSSQDVRAPALLESDGGSDSLLGSERLEISSLSIWLQSLEAVQRNDEQIWGIALHISPTHLRLYALHIDSLNILEQLRQLEGKEWKFFSDWAQDASILTEQYRTLQWTLTKWIQQGNKNLGNELTPFLNRTRYALERLRQKFPVIQQAPNSD